MAASAAHTPSTSASPLPFVTDHAADRWLERVVRRYDDVAPWDLPYAFAESPPVGVPASANQGRLYEPTRSVIIYARSAAGWATLITVLHAGGTRLNTAHLHRCHECGLRFDPSGLCPWCRDDHPKNHPEM